MANPAWVPGMAAPNPGGHTRQQRIKAQKLSEVIRARWKPGAIATWLMAVVEGKDPDAADGEGHIKPPWEIRMKAAQMLVDRGFGGVPQHVMMEAELRVQASGTLGLIDASQLPMAELVKLEAGLGKLLATVSDPLDAIDAESVEK